MTQNRDRKGKIRARMAATGEPYTEAARHVDIRDPKVRATLFGQTAEIGSRTTDDDGGTADD